MKFITCKKVFKYKGDGQFVPGEVTHVRFDQSVIEVDDDAFQHRFYLTEVVFNEGLQKIGNNAFHGCSEPIDITFPSSISEIGDSAFQHCCGLHHYNAYKDTYEIVLNEGLKKIGKYSFAGCSNVDTIILPTTIVEVGYRAFFNAMDLKEVVFNGVIPKIVGKSAFAYHAYTSLERFVFLGLAARLKAIIDAGQVEVARKVGRIPRIQWRDGRVSVSVKSLHKDWDNTIGEVNGGVVNWTSICNSIDELNSLITQYELKEAKVLLELALWKHKMRLLEEERAGELDAREHCRISCRSDVVIKHVMPYLLPGDIC